MYSKEIHFTLTSLPEYHILKAMQTLHYLSEEQKKNTCLAACSGLLNKPHPTYQPKHREIMSVCASEWERGKEREWTGLLVHESSKTFADRVNQQHFVQRYLITQNFCAKTQNTVFIIERKRVKIKTKAKFKPTKEVKLIQLSTRRKKTISGKGGRVLFFSVLESLLKFEFKGFIYFKGLFIIILSLTKACVPKCIGLKLSKIKCNCCLLDYFLEEKTCTFTKSAHILIKNTVKTCFFIWNDCFLFYLI